MIETIQVLPGDILAGDALFNEIDNSHWIVTSTDGTDPINVYTQQSAWPFAIPADIEVTVDREV